MEKIFLTGTYGYKNFIDEATKTTLLDWTFSNLTNFKDNTISPYRKYKKIKVEDSIHSLVMNLKTQIINQENITNWITEPDYEDYIGVNLTGGKIHRHKDDTQSGYTHTRWNLILSYPESGGHSIYNDETNILEEKLIWKCEASEYFHSSTEVVGDKPRITLSLGFLIPKI